MLCVFTVPPVCPQVIDEIYRVLRYVNSTRAPQRAHEVLQELRDISSMAMEYFDEKIVPILKKKLPGGDLSGRLIGSAPGKINVTVLTSHLESLTVAGLGCGSSGLLRSRLNQSEDKLSRLSLRTRAASMCSQRL